ncbi:nonsense-mediated mRNA decay protein 2-like [Quercus lobata]|uniref:nonsense-mediated mRNA decay protein 2-like n=1 Tax=Quercus lobata TaxID=97700 RepID=UPI0012484390|nr:nonsense-mediated mRNA decay protein 2-like [Quercus lobata]
MKQECSTYLKTIGESKALATTLSDTEPEHDFDNEDDGILNVFTATFQCIDAYLDTLSDELCQVNTRVGRIAGQQARLGGFVESPSPSPEASEDDEDDSDDDDDDSDDDDDDEDGDASSPSDDEMSI